MKNILLMLIISVLLTACSEQKIEYTQKEVKYLETMKAAVDQLENYQDKFDVALEKRKNEKSEETAKGLFEGIMAFGMINEVLKKESAPERFKEVHDEF
ncbi:hypothetical protein [Paenibacillus fonticola]|uniref:hypothetical protein n=1 Tax=Paenibacillus fonticola TaxID=379896 RepID=UPI00036EBCF2|nr:hypothetical protein [Paenibacillus fonticola]